MLTTTNRGEYLAASPLRNDSSVASSARPEDGSIPRWVHRGFDLRSCFELTDIEEAYLPMPPRIQPADPTDHRAVQNLSSSTSVSELVHAALARSGYALHHIRCSCDDECVVLYGHASRYFHLQMALQVARLLADGRRIEMQIEIVTTADREPSANPRIG